VQSTGLHLFLGSDVLVSMGAETAKEVLQVLNWNPRSIGLQSLSIENMN